MPIRRTAPWLPALLLAASAAAAEAFQFDVWRSGMKVEKVIEIGRGKGLSVVPAGGGVPLLGKKDPDDLAERVEYRCSTKLMGYPARIQFSFAPESKVLHTVHVEINLPLSAEKADLEVLADAIAKQLDAKYKDAGDMGSGGLLGHLSDKLRDVKRRAWRGGSDVVTLEATDKVMGDELLITYVDEKLAERARIEDRRIREKKLERSSGGDKGKF